MKIGRWVLGFKPKKIFFTTQKLSRMDDDDNTQTFRLVDLMTGWQVNLMNLC